MKLLPVVALLFTFIVSGYPQTPRQDVYEVYAIEYAASDARVPLKNVAVNATSSDSISFSFYIWLLKGEGGRRVLVDTGFLKDSTKKGTPPAKYVRPDRALQRVHLDGDEITDVIITHPHYDHIGGLDLFKKATVWMQQADYEYLVGGAWQEGGNNRGLDKRDVLKIVQLNLDGRLRLVRGDSVEILPGIRAFTGSRHTFTSQHLLVSTATERVLLASDDVWFYYNLQNLLAAALAFDRDAYVREMKRMKTLVSSPDLIIPGHDALVLTKFPSVAEGVVRIR